MSDERRTMNGIEFTIIDLGADRNCYATHEPGTPQEGPDICTGAELRDRMWLARSLGKVGSNTGVRICQYNEGDRVCLRKFVLGGDDSVEVTPLLSGSSGDCLLEDPGYTSAQYPDGLPPDLPTFEDAKQIEI